MTRARAVRVAVRGAGSRRARVPVGRVQGAMRQARASSGQGTTERRPRTATCGQQLVRRVAVRYTRDGRDTVACEPPFIRLSILVSGVIFGLGATSEGFCIHAKNKIAGRMITFLVLGFWDKNTGTCAGAMPYRRDFPTTTRI